MYVDYMRKGFVKPGGSLIVRLFLPSSFACRVRRMEVTTAGPISKPKASSFAHILAHFVLLSTTNNPTHIPSPPPPKCRKQKWAVRSTWRTR